MRKRVMALYQWLNFVFCGNKKVIKGRSNVIILNASLARNVIFDIKGNNNTIVLGDNAVVKNCRIIIRGDNHVFDIGNNVSLQKSEFKFEDHDCSIRIGNNTRIMKHSEISAAEPFSSIEIGADCLFSSNIDIRSTDSHSILDLATGMRINPAKNIKIGNKVWVGAYVQILKGVVIGNNSIIGIRSLVTKEVPSHCLAAGVPAKIIKANVDWCGERI